jgi:hypothetical protein
MSTAAPLTVGFWNCRVTVPIGKVERDLRRVLPKCDVLGLVEWGKERRQMVRAMDKYDIATPGHRSGSVAWDNGRFRLVRSRYEVAAEGRHVGRIKGLRTRLPDYQVAVVTLRDLTTGGDGRDQDYITVIVCHAPVWRPGGRAKMHREYLTAVAKLHRRYERAGHAVYTLGDWNRTPRFMARFAEQANAVSLWTARKPRATHHRRSIDDIYSRCRAREVALIDTASDHRAVLATY